MAKVIWKGEDTETVPGPSFTTCYGLKFPKDVPVELTDPDMLRRARGNLNFKVIEEEGKKQQEKSHGESQTQDKSKAKVEVKDEAKEKDYDYHEAEKTSGYTPVKKKVRKRKERTADPSAPF